MADSTGTSGRFTIERLEDRIAPSAFYFCDGGSDKHSSRKGSSKKHSSKKCKSSKKHSSKKCKGSSKKHSSKKCKGSSKKKFRGKFCKR